MPPVARTAQRDARYGERAVHVLEPAASLRPSRSIDGLGRGDEGVQTRVDESVAELPARRNRKGAGPRVNSKPNAISVLDHGGRHRWGQRSVEFVGLGFIYY